MRHYQHITTLLSDIGREQAHTVAKRFATIPVEIIISSEMSRALETAEVISKTTGVEVLPSSLFHEILRPSAVRGRSMDDGEVVRLIQDTEAHFTDPSWKHSDEENFFDLKERAMKAIVFLELRPEANICVVTHGTILRMIFGVLLLGKDFSPELFSKLWTFLEISNTGITVCEKKLNDIWRLIVWNDSVHVR